MRSPDDPEALAELARIEQPQSEWAAEPTSDSEWRSARVWLTPTESVRNCLCRLL